MNATMPGNLFLMLRMLCVWTLMLAAAGCGAETPPRWTALPTISTTVNGTTLTLEVADDDQERARGLMYRESMPPDHGMVFIWSSPQPRSFYMRDTLIPLDIVFLDPARRIVDIRQMKPLDQTSIPSAAPAQYAIELNAGTARRLGLSVGDPFPLPTDLKSSDGK
jgi:uncharacterized protein